MITKFSAVLFIVMFLTSCSDDGISKNEIQGSSRAKVDFSRKFTWVELILQANPSKKDIKVSEYEVENGNFAHDVSIKDFVLYDRESFEDTYSIGKPPADCLIEHNQISKLFSGVSFYRVVPPSEGFVLGGPFRAWVDAGYHDIYIGNRWVYIGENKFLTDHTLYGRIRKINCLND